MEVRYRQRYLDLIANDRAREIFLRRAQIVRELRRFFDARGYIGLATALARLDNKPVNDDNLAAYFLDRLNDKTAPASVRLMALRAGENLSQAPQHPRGMGHGGQRAGDGLW